MDKHILKIDTDTKFLFQTKSILIERLSYLEDSGAFPIKYIDKIFANKKKNWNVKIFLNKDISENLIIMLQLILGSDWKKEVNTMINHFALNMEYSNRLFDIKKYSNGKIKTSKTLNITDEILDKIKNPKRKKFKS